MHRESAGEGAGLPRTCLGHTGTLRVDAGQAPQGGTSADPRREAGGAGIRAARTRKGRFSAEQRAALRRSAALIAETRALLARVAAERSRPKPARPPRLRVVGGREWSGE